MKLVRDPLTLTVGRAVVRRHALADAAPLARHANDPGIAANLRDAFPHPYTLANAEAFIGAQLALQDPTAFVILVDGEPCGGIGYVPLHDVERVGAEVGYWLARPFWGQGIMSAVLAAFARAVFAREPSLHRLFALPFAANAASARVLEKAGFRREGTLRQAVIKGGKVQDQHVYALLRDELPPA
jgi:RimJ/RimL family protein N-acetyltransferase